MGKLLTALLSLFLLLAGVLHAPPAQAEGVVFLTRHAEKSLDVPGDAAPLLPVGNDRARTLARMLADAGIDELVTTDALRSRQTGAPFAELSGLQPQVMTREEEVAYAARLRQAPDTKDRLIVGHTRNIPRILDALGVPNGGQIKLDPDTDYDNLFVIQMYPDRPATMVRLRYQIANPN
ncbi:histidine phosphatase family protein [Thalassobaculum sp.]|uniref:histidine phosphatase family protein n=1 Tax=Thalassobaculum sp. TaxID=2022740 RepID=UPI0032EEEB50